MLVTPLAAQIAVGLLLLILVRSLAEYFRQARPLRPDLLKEPLYYVTGSLLTAIAALVAFLLYVAGEFAASVIFCTATVATLFVSKLWATRRRRRS